MNLVKNASDAVKAFLRVGNASNMSKFFLDVERYLDEKEYKLKGVITSTNNKLEDVEVNKLSLAVNIDLDRISRADQREDYAKEYLKKLANFEDTLEGGVHLREKLEEAVEELQRVEEVRKYLSSLKSKVEAYLKEIGTSEEDSKKK